MSGAATDRAMPVKIAYVAYPGFTALDRRSLRGDHRLARAEVHFLARPLDPVRCDRGLMGIATDHPDVSQEQSTQNQKPEVSSGVAR